MMWVMDGAADTGQDEGGAGGGQQRPGRFERTPLEGGPVVFRVQITKRG
jgi:hypothetical protein